MDKLFLSMVKIKFLAHFPLDPLADPGVSSLIFLLRLFAIIFIIVVVVTSFRVFHISVARWFLSGVLMTSNLLKSPGLFTVFLPI